MECSGVLPCLSCVHCRSDLKKYIEIFHGTCSVLCSFTDVVAGDGYPASWLGSRTDPQGGHVAMSRLFTSFESCQLKVQSQAGASAGVRIETCMGVPCHYVTLLYVLRFSCDDVDQNV